jgi:WD40 repeat protein
MKSMQSTQHRSQFRPVLTLFALCLALSACGDDEPTNPDTTCEAGQLCECTLPTDCPAGETCSASFCVPSVDAVGDTTTTPDTGGEDTDTTTELDTSPDVVEDTDSGPADTADVADVETPDVQNDTDPDTQADVQEDTTTPDTRVEDGGGFPDPGNPWIAYIQADQLRFIHADGTDDIAWSGPESDLVFSADWSPNGQSLAILAADSDANGGLQVLNFTTRTVNLVSLELDSMEIKPFTSVAWSPDGDTIAFAYRPRGAGTLSGIYTVSVSAITAAGDSAVVPTRAATPLSGDTYPIWGQQTGDLYFLRTDDGDTSIVKLDFPSGSVEDVVTGLDILGIFDIDGTEENAIAQVSGSGASGALSTVEIDGDDGAFGLNGDAAPSFFPAGDNRVAITRNFAAGGSPQIDMVVVDLDTETPSRITSTGISAGPAFMSVAPIDNGDATLGPFPF